MSAFNYEKDADGIVTVIMDMTGPVNAMTQEYGQSMQDTLTKLEAEQGLSGVVLASAKKVFFAGGDLKRFVNVQPGEEQALFEEIEYLKGQLRRLERLPVPVVAAINGAALGGGYEICLACNYRIAYNHKSVQVGLPEVTLGLLPGGGGVVRLVYQLGIEKALPLLTEGYTLVPTEAQSVGLIDELVDSVDELIPRAKAFILANKTNEAAAVQPWDRKGFTVPGGGVESAAINQFIVAAAPTITAKTRGLLPAPGEILDCAVSALRVDIDTALRIETRGLTRLLLTLQAKNLITTNFFQMNQINSGSSRPHGYAKNPVKKVGVIGAGLMGQGIAYVSAAAGIDVVLKDVSKEAAEKGKAYSAKVTDRKVARGRMTETQQQALLAHISATADDADLTGCDLIIEAVFEQIDLKNSITQSTEKYLADNGIWGTNTSTLPITKLAQASSRPENFIGIHFFSPVDRMPLIEIICGEKTSDEVLARTFDYARQIKKSAIVVNDSFGFYTSRTIRTFLEEGIRLLHEGISPIRIDNLAKAVGMPLGPLTLIDEVSLQLLQKMHETWKSMGTLNQWGDESIFYDVIDTMVAVHNRGGRHHGGGFYEYTDDQGKVVWPPLLDLYGKADIDISDQDIKDRILFRPVIESLKCLETNVLSSVADGNIGSILGISAPAWTGGYIQFVNTYGLQNFIDRCGQLEQEYGRRFRAPAIVQEKLSANELFV